MDLVTVYISTYNRVEKLKRALRSVESQTYSNIEIIVSDDCSNDGTREYMVGYAKKNQNVKYLRNDVNSGACVTRNNAIFNASGKFITGLDDDDEFSPDRISTLLKYWDDKYSFICADFIESYVNYETAGYYNKDTMAIYKYNDLLFDNVASNQVLTLTDRLKNIGGFDPSVRRLQDWDTWLRLSYAYGDFLFINKCLYIMNHDHKANEKRVSSSYSLNVAIEELMYRNKSIYGDSFKLRKCYIDYLKKELTMIDSIYWARKEKKISNFLRFFYQRFKNYGE